MRGNRPIKPSSAAWRGVHRPLIPPSSLEHTTDNTEKARQSPVISVTSRSRTTYSWLGMLSTRTTQRMLAQRRDVHQRSLGTMCINATRRTTCARCHAFRAYTARDTAVREVSNVRITSHSICATTITLARKKHETVLGNHARTKAVRSIGVACIAGPRNMPSRRLPSTLRTCERFTTSPSSPAQRQAATGSKARDTSASLISSSTSARNIRRWPRVTRLE